MIKRPLVIFGLLCIDFGAFLGIVTLLPEKGNFTHSGWFSHFINSRASWDIAWGSLVSLLIISLGVYLLMEAFGVFKKAD